MKKLNYGFGVTSLILGLGLVIASFPAGIISVGFILGSLLAINGLVRLWLAWQRPLAGHPSTYRKQSRSIHRQEDV